MIVHHLIRNTLDNEILNEVLLTIKNESNKIAFPNLFKLLAKRIFFVFTSCTCKIYGMGIFFFGWFLG